MTSNTVLRPDMGGLLDRFLLYLFDCSRLRRHMRTRLRAQGLTAEAIDERMREIAQSCVASPCEYIDKYVDATGRPVWWVRWLPNMLSATRLLLTPFVACQYYLKDLSHYQGTYHTDGAVAGYPMLVPLIFLLVFSDAVDGFWARRFKVETRLGRILDPLADRVATVSIIVAWGALVADMFPKAVLGSLMTVGWAVVAVDLAVGLIAAAEWFTGRNPGPEQFGKTKFGCYGVALILGLCGTLGVTPTTQNEEAWSQIAAIAVLWMGLGFGLLSIWPHCRNLTRR